MIGLSLQALASDPSLWRKTGAGEENLLFRDTDYQSPENSTTLHVLRDHVDPRVRQIGQRMGQLAHTTSYLDVPPLEPVVVTPWTTRVSSRLKTALTPPPTPDVVVPLTPLSAPTKPSAWWSDHLERPVVDFDSLQVDAEVQRIRAEFERSVLRYFPMLFRDYTAMRLMQSYPISTWCATNRRWNSVKGAQRSTASGKSALYAHTGQPRRGAPPARRRVRRAQLRCRADDQRHSIDLSTGRGRGQSL
ncbi:MAG: hypothetical protein IPK17_38865 [Chloroflexi bacterium]|uniref:hypothetical protein n=1 Tax=Candidatus Flexifilum breve TaxID=3140694 RepID=UPI003136544F|nr:hypothetical protein [Chloroflexota bacterium]